MRTTINIDDDLLARAKEMFGDFKTNDFVKECIEERMQSEAYMRLAALGGTEPEARAPERRRAEISES